MELAPKKRDEIETVDVVLGTNHVVLLANGDWLFMCIRYLCFGNKWHNVHLKHSVSPIRL